MPAGQLDSVICHLRTIAFQEAGSQAEDVELLERFINHRDNKAFELLVRRHGPMVLGVSKRILGNDADAQDAFQATFLVFVRKANAILPRAQVGNWLHGVAHKTALKARAMNSKRRVKEQEAATQTRAGTDDRWEFLLEILDDELRALPERYRAPIILCDLEGLSYREAAAQLRCPLGTLSGRLTRARTLLARRLARRCPTVTAATLAALLARAASAALPPSLSAWTIRAGTTLAALKVVPDGVVSAKVASLTEGVLKMLLLTRLKIVTAGFLLLTAALALGWMCAARGSADDAVAPPRQTHSTDGPAKAPEARFVFQGREKASKTVSLVVEGTSAPILCLPLKEETRVIIGGRPVGIDSLRQGARVTIRMDSTNSVIEEMRAFDPPGKVAVVAKPADLARGVSPSEAEVLQALPKRPDRVAAILKVSRTDVTIVTEQLVKQVDPPRLYPQVGVAELHHCHWKCTVYYTEIVESSYPFPVSTKRPRVEVVYIDRDCLVPIK
jgi:RNA polymerase sigma factor (sigma-70 family)